MRSSATNVVGALGVEMMNARQASSEAVVIPRPTRYNMECDGRMADSPPSTAALSNPPTFFKIPSKYYSLVGRSAVQDADITITDGRVAGGPTGKSAANGSMRRVASEALFRGGGALPTPGYDLRSGMAPGGGSSEVLSQFSKQSSALTTQPASTASLTLAAAAAAAAVTPAPLLPPATVVAAASSTSPQLPAGSVAAQPPQQPQPPLLNRNSSSLLGFFSPSESAHAAAAQPRQPSEVAKSTGAASPGAGRGKLIARILSPELATGLSKPGASSRWRGGINAKELNALAPMDM